MAVFSKIPKKDLVSILNEYDLGTYSGSQALSRGSVQTNLLIQTLRSQFVLRLYENRSHESVQFEVNLLAYLNKHKFPCPSPLRKAQGATIGHYSGKPYVVFDFITGKYVSELNKNQKKGILQTVADLHKTTSRYKPKHKASRWNYNLDFCRKQATARANEIGSSDSADKLHWYLSELEALQIPSSLPKGICHCDFDPGNLLFDGDNLVALIDFDDANYTYLLFDLVSLVDLWAWEYEKDLDLKQARSIVQEYRRHRMLNSNEQRHIFDIHKLDILIDCLWFFDRGNANDFHEKRKINHLDQIGRVEYHRALVR